ncbi:MAG: T9SS type A sorting domain-containing protein [Bacteroidota bacterium]
MKIKYLIGFLLVSKILLAQNTIDTLYNLELGAQSFTNIITDSINNKTYIICNSANYYANDSSSFAHTIIYEYLQDGSIKELNRISHNYWTIGAISTLFAEPDKFICIKQDTTSINFGQYQKQFYVIVQTNDGWKTFTQTKLNIPYNRYSLHGFLKTSKGYIITGLTDRVITSPAFIAGYDLSLNLKWVKVLSFETRIASVLPANNGYIITGTKDNPANSGIGSIWQAKIDTIGNIIWQNDFNDSVKYYASSIFTQGVKLGSLYYNVGFTCLNYNNYPLSHGYLSAVNENGNLVIEKFYNQHQNFVFQHVIENNNSLYLTANIDSTVTVDTNIIYGHSAIVYGHLTHFSKISADGKIQWYQIYQHLPNDNRIENIYKTTNGFMMCGGSFNQNRKKEFDSIGYADEDAWFLKVDTNGCIVPGCNPNFYSGIQHIISDNSLIEVYPNPSSDNITVNLKGNNFSEQLNDVTLFDATGKELFHQILKSHQSSIIIQRLFNYSGLAFVVVKNSFGTFYKKIILL